MSYLGPNSPIPEKGKGSKLSHKQQLFIDEYFVDLVASQAVVRAGYKTNNPNRIATELLNHPLVVQEIEKRKAERTAKLELKADYIIEKLVTIVEKNGIKTADQIRALELLGKSIALWKERQEISGPDGAAIEMEQKIKEDVADFTRAITRLSEREGKTGMAVVPLTGANGRT